MRAEHASVAPTLMMAELMQWSVVAYIFPRQSSSKSCCSLGTLVKARRTALYFTKHGPATHQSTVHHGSGEDVLAVQVRVGANREKTTTSAAAGGHTPVYSREATISSITSGGSSRVASFAFTSKRCGCRALSASGVRLWLSCSVPTFSSGYEGIFSSTSRP